MQAVAAAAGVGVINRQAEVVAAQEPLEGAARLLAPAGIAGEAIRFQAGGGRRLGLHRLLVEACLLAAAHIEAVRADGHKVAAHGG